MQSGKQQNDPYLQVVLLGYQSLTVAKKYKVESQRHSNKFAPGLNPSFCFDRFNHAATANSHSDTVTFHSGPSPGPGD